MSSEALGRRRDRFREGTLVDLWQGIEGYFPLDDGSVTGDRNGCNGGCAVTRQIRRLPMFTNVHQYLDILKIRSKRAARYLPFPVMSVSVAGIQ